MLRNRYHSFWMSPADGGGAGAEAGAGDGQNPAGTEAGAGGEPNPAGGEQKQQGGEAVDYQAQVEQLRAEIQKHKQALDNATSEAAKYKRELRTKQTQEEIDAANKKEAEEKQAAHVAELEKKVAMIEATKSVMGNLGVDEATAGNIAECLIGCENVDNALLLIKQAWDAKEKSLRAEFGKIPGPGTGGSSANKEEEEAIRLAKEMAKGRNSGSVMANLGSIIR